MDTLGDEPPLDPPAAALPPAPTATASIDALKPDELKGRAALFRGCPRDATVSDAR